MNRRQKMVEETKDEWRELGFYYICDDDAKEWILTGSKSGLMRFCECLGVYGKNEGNSGVSEHDHFGPYMYLKIMTWSEAGVNGRSIHGSLKDLLRLSELIKNKLEASREGDSVVISSEYTETCEYKIRLNVMSHGFDPASPDPMKWADKVAEN